MLCNALYDFHVKLLLLHSTMYIYRRVIPRRPTSIKIQKYTFRQKYTFCIRALVKQFCYTGRTNAKTTLFYNYFTSHSLKIGLNISPCRKGDMFKLEKSRPVYFSTKEKLILILFDKNIYKFNHFSICSTLLNAQGKISKLQT